MSRVVLYAATSAACAMLVAVPAVAKEMRLSPEQISGLEIKIEPVRQTSSELVAELPATVVCPPNAHLVATAPYAGTVTQVLVLPGQHVPKGTELARVSSRELFEAKSKIAQAEADLRAAEAIARRKRFMADKNLQSPTIAEEAEAQVQRLRAVLEHYQQATNLNGIVSGDGGAYTIFATADGTVAEIDIMPGDNVEAMGATVSLDTSEDLWAEVQVPAEFVAKVRPGDPVTLSDGEQGRVLSVASNLDPKTRSAKMYAELPTGTDLLPGQMISLKLMRAASSASFSVPAQAVTRISNETVIFIKTPDGFAAKSVRLLAKSATVATIAGDLSASTEVAASGIPQLEQILAGE